MNARPTSRNTRELEAFLRIYNELAHSAATGTFIYRGEHKIYDRVSSSLYRRHRNNDEAGLGTEAIQEEILEQARAHAPEMSDPEMDEAILAELRHNGGETNVIDFTRDYLVAMFFACDGAPYKAGQVHFLPEMGEGYNIFEPLEPVHKVTTQKSVLVRPYRGFVEPISAVRIEPEEKPAVLEQLRIQHGISAETIYNDLYGLIQHQQIHRKAYNRLYEGTALSARDEYQYAIERYTKCIRRNPQMRLAYFKRAEAYHELDDYDGAIPDYQRALSFDPRDDQAHHNLGVIFLEQRKYAEAIEEFNQALQVRYDRHAHYYRFEAWLLMGDWEQAKHAATQTNDPEGEMTWDIIAELMREYYESVSDFEQQHQIRLPDDIAETLGGR